MRDFDLVPRKAPETEAETVEALLDHLQWTRRRLAEGWANFWEAGLDPALARRMWAERGAPEDAFEEMSHDEAVGLRRLLAKWDEHDPDVHEGLAAQMREMGLY